MKIVFITGGYTPYRVAFCDSINKYMQDTKKGHLKLFLLSEQGFNANYDYSSLIRPYAEILKGKTFVMKDHTTRFMINPKIVQKVKEENPDFIILGGSWTHPSTWILLKGKKRIGAPIYFWAESHFHNGLKRKQKVIWKEIIKRIIYNKFDGFFVPGLYAREAIEETHCKNADKCVQLPNLVENDKYVQAALNKGQKLILREKYQIEKNRIVLFTPSRLVDLKGIMEFLENGRDELKNSVITWIIAGMGPLKNQIQEYYKKNEIDVRLLGFVSQNEISECLTLSDWFLLPSLSDPNPLSVIEALWAEMPLALSKYVGNNPETLKHMENGLLFDTLSSESVSETIRIIKETDDNWIKAAGKKSGYIAHSQFDLNVQTKNLVLKIEEIIKDS